jgi:F0F1-type ATP synthase assembly protein I
MSDRKPYKRGSYVGLGLVLGTFIGILLDKLALGMIFGFFIGVAMDSKRSKQT